MKDHHAGTYTCHATIDDGGVTKNATESSVVTVRGEKMGVPDKLTNYQFSLLLIKCFEFRKHDYTKGRQYLH